MLFLLLFSILISSNVFALSSEHAIVIDKGEVIAVSPDSIYGTVIGNVASDSTILFYYLKNPCYPDKKLRREKDEDKKVIYVCRSSPINFSVSNVFPIVVDRFDS